VTDSKCSMCQGTGVCDKHCGRSYGMPCTKCRPQPTREVTTTTRNRLSLSRSHIITALNRAYGLNIPEDAEVAYESAWAIDAPPGNPLPVTDFSDSVIAVTWTVADATTKENQ
jgi:hypothetical protein